MHLKQVFLTLTMRLLPFQKVNEESYRTYFGLPEMGGLSMTRTSKSEVPFDGVNFERIRTNKTLQVNEVRLPKLEIPPVIRTPTAVYHTQLIEKDINGVEYTYANKDELAFGTTYEG